MFESGMQCSGCGSTNVSFDPERRILVCNQCGKEEYYSRATLNANAKIVFSRQNAIQFFVNGKYEMANNYAHDVINIVKDNAPALYMIAYYDDYVRGNTRSLKSFFMFTKDTALEYDETVELMQLFLASAHSIIDFEAEVITAIAKNLQAPSEAEMLCGFIDKLCPFLIDRRPSMSFLNDEMIGLYSELAAHCGIPKTCFALIKAIQANPDSPYTGNTFFLKSKAKYFYDHFVVPVGKIVSAMAPGEYRDKFRSAYEHRKKKYEMDAGIEN